MVAALAVSVVLLALGVLKLQKQHKEFLRRTQCVGNLVRIRLAKEMCAAELQLTDGMPIPESTLANFLRRAFPPDATGNVCPDGGCYSINPVGIEPECSYTNVCYSWRFNKQTKRLECRAWTHTL